MIDHCDQRLVNDGWAPYEHEEAGGTDIAATVEAVILAPCSRP